ncbi:MAG: hypothetical protein AAB737_01695, partial [Patescibacteria group bacterium]
MLRSTLSKKFAVTLFLCFTLFFVSLAVPYTAFAQEAIVPPDANGNCPAGYQSRTPGNFPPQRWILDALTRLGLINARICVQNEIAESSAWVQTASVDTSELDSCNVTNFGFYRCFWNPLIASLSSIPASIGAWILTVSGMLFNFLVHNTIIDFKGAIFDKIGDGINTAWTAFRDIANIAIIGMFTFIAISLILGIKEYGERKMIARVLIIAVLINFSLLFTKMIIDASNFTASQFYRAAELKTGTVSGDVTIGQLQKTSGLADSFLRSMGIASAGDVYNAVLAVQGQDEGRWWVTILFGLFIGAVFLAAAAVLLYGSFLLIARALLLIFLMIVSPLAFASWLIPKFSQLGWSAWWDSLLKNAVFAPLLMVLLWVSLRIAQKFQAEGSTLGSLVGDKPQTTFGTEALFSYLMILGMLFMSIKLASKFSSTIAGFGGAAMAAAAPFTLGARFAGGLLRG